MPKRTDISTILIIGAGPIVIGQACEFDYSGTQACKTLKEEGYRIVLVNSNPATIMTDPELADATYIEPITPEIVAKIIEKERHVAPGGFALLPTMGGQTALNCALSLRKQGTLEKFDVEMIGATADAIDKAEDRQLFRDAMEKIGLQTPRSRLANASALKKSDRDKYLADQAKLSGPELEAFKRQWEGGENERRKRYQQQALAEALMALSDIGLPAIIRPSFTLGGTGKENEDRHPKIRHGVLIGAGAKILGNIEIGHCARIAAGSVVVKPVPHNVTVAGVPAKIVGEAGCAEPSRTMDQMLSAIGL